MTFLRLLIVLAALGLAAPAAARAEAPGATTGDATNITATTATLNGVVDPHTESTTYYFEYGTTAAYGAKTPNGTEKGNAGKKVNAGITGLTPGTTYHFRLVATNPSGTDFGADKTFTTQASPYTLPGQYTLTAAANPATITYGRTGTISGQLSGPNVSGVPIQLQQTPYPYTAPMANTGTPVAADATGRYSFSVSPRLNTRFQAVAATAPPTVSSVVQMLVRQRVTFRVSDSTVRRGQRVRFRGTVSPAHNGRRVRIQRRTRTGSWRTVTRALLRKTTVATRSRYSKRIRIRRRGVYRVRATRHADHARGTSRRRTIRIG